jgi:hypothetical protein
MTPRAIPNDQAQGERNYSPRANGILANLKKADFHLENAAMSKKEDDDFEDDDFEDDAESEQKTARKGEKKPVNTKMMYPLLLLMLVLVSLERCSTGY